MMTQRAKLRRLAFIPRVFPDRRSWHAGLPAARSAAMIADDSFSQCRSAVAPCQGNAAGEKAPRIRRILARSAAACRSCTAQLWVWLRPFRGAARRGRRALDRQPAAGAGDDGARQGAAKPHGGWRQRPRPRMKRFELAEFDRPFVADPAMARPAAAARSRPAIVQTVGRKRDRPGFGPGPRASVGHAASTAASSATSARRTRPRQQRQPRPALSPSRSSAGIAARSRDAGEARIAVARIVGKGDARPCAASRSAAPSDVEQRPHQRHIAVSAAASGAMRAMAASPLTPLPR